MTFTTGDVQNAGTDAKVFMKVFGANGSTSEIFIDKNTDRFERGKIDLIKVIYHFFIYKLMVGICLNHDKIGMILNNDTKKIDTIVSCSLRIASTH